MTIDCACGLRVPWVAKSFLQRVAHHVISAEGFAAGYLSVTVVGRRRMITLHARHLGSPAVTDVLSFDLGTDRRARYVCGDVVVCADVARNRTRTRAAARAELALYLVHGLLHLAGYDDRSPANFRRMHVREDELLSELGLGPVFSAPN